MNLYRSCTALIAKRTLLASGPKRIATVWAPARLSTSMSWGGNRPGILDGSIPLKLGNFDHHPYIPLKFGNIDHPYIPLKLGNIDHPYILLIYMNIYEFYMHLYEFI